MPTYDLGLEHVSLAFATKTVFTDVTQGVFEGDRIGIVGRNGDGKSTLLKLLAGTQEPDSGRVTRRNGLTFGMLTQRDTLDDNATLREAALEGREDYEWASQQQSREIVEALLGGMNLDAKVGSLSGGQRRRADLARLLLKEWDILALDEPTNHLDVITIHWLAEHLKNRWNRGTGALLLVTHDRWFLDEVCESMWEVHDGRIEPFEGGYSAYMLQRVERDRQADVRETKRRNLARKELAWLSRGARARSTKQKFHVKAATELIADVPPIRNTVELKQMATSRLGKQVVDLVDVTQIYDREQGSYADIDPDAAALAANTRSASTVDVVEPMVREPQVFGSVTIAVDDADDPRLTSAFGARAGEVAAEHGLTHHEPEGEINALRGTRGEAETAPDETSAAVEITVSGRKILDDVTWLIGPGDRFGIVGANGAGKSTLLKILDGTLTPTAGRVNIGKTVRFAVLSQRLDELEKLGKYKVKEVLSRYKPSYIVDGKEVTPGQLMERLGFEAAQLMTPIRDLSGGQKRRMQLLLILLDEPNVLIMDEPGNDLDTDMLAVMEDLLDTWPGTLIVVSHDRYLLERVTDEQFALIGGKVRHLPGGVQDYLDMVEQLKRGEDPLGLEGAAAGAAGENVAGGASDGAASAASETLKLSGKAYADASRRVSAIERKLEKLETQKERLEEQMAAHDPSDYVGLNELNGQLQALTTESEDLEAEWLDLSEQMGQ
ncbi:ABC-F family ATP-binding cassette domain-containing protein [Bifidobacterium pseudolongum]|uniref:ABC-F family ATP-binding cassette domain-containing protein n=1 Tax=Bifidobacterium pseudolongum TaxID=1694 RepID=UPI0005086D59|nr:ABC-F family ATP-binding cassette domain-containing protein [Bifidobacterium pseudolongum]KFI78138.1 ABC transporter ATPase [Bifidobacterium pseudolongum subsp. pseudolongum]UNP91576.1 ABC-F family ATP-binding cassette domain-containing protein [Bifidobacterium pseudolongum subsp. pseudolongum]WCA40703.1 ABC-F family ATP-binding cassette domain-containing protein [Bifidobacterium pseudolongum subsp. pseudolongum]